MVETIQCFGDSPLPRFGHTITKISETKAILFGGATGILFYKKIIYFFFN